MSQGFENYEPAPLEFFHGELMRLFHSYREDTSLTLECTISGNTLNNLIAKAKIETYKKYINIINDKAVLKT